MPFFTPPTAPLVPPTVRRNHPGHTLFRHYRPWDAGLNVWLTVDDVVTDVEPEPELVKRTFHGGHIHDVSDAEAVLLIAAGYEVGLPPFGYGSRRYNQGAYGGAI